MSKYKVLTDGNGSDLIQVVGLGIYVPLSKLQAAQHEAEALAATVEALRVAALNAIHRMSGGEAKADLRDAYDATPQQNLRDVRAEAVSKFIDFMYSSSDCQLCSKSLDAAVKYVKYVSDGEVK